MNTKEIAKSIYKIAELKTFQEKILPWITKNENYSEANSAPEYYFRSNPL